MTAMGGGIAGKGGPCGALTGGTALLGSILGRTGPGAKDDPMLWKACHVFYKRFDSEIADKHGGIDCKDIAGVDWGDREALKAFYTGDGVKTCIENTGKAAKILGEVIEKYFKD